MRRSNSSFSSPPPRRTGRPLIARRAMAIRIVLAALGCKIGGTRCNRCVSLSSSCLSRICHVTSQSWSPYSTMASMGVIVPHSGKGIPPPSPSPSRGGASCASSDVSAITTRHHLLRRGTDESTPVCVPFPTYTTSHEHPRKPRLSRWGGMGLLSATCRAKRRVSCELSLLKSGILGV